MRACVRAHIMSPLSATELSGFEVRCFQDSVEGLNRDTSDGKMKWREPQNGSVHRCITLRVPGRLEKRGPLMNGNFL